MKHSLFSIQLILLCFFITITSFSQNSSEELTSIKGKNVLLVYGGWKGHKPAQFADLLSKWLIKEGANVTLSDSLAIYTNENIMKSTDLIIQHWTMGELSKEQSKSLLKTVKNGTGIVGVHGGTGDSFRNNTAYQYMIGGQFVSHPGGKIDFEVTIKSDKHPITKGLSDFKVTNTEQYYMHIDPRINVLASTTFSDKYNNWIGGTEMPVCWTTNYDKGRVFYYSVGHFITDFDKHESWELLTRGIKWAVKN